MSSFYFVSFYGLARLFGLKTADFRNGGMFQVPSISLGLLLRPLEVIVLHNGWIHFPSIDEETLNHFIPVARIHNYPVYMTVIRSRVSLCCHYGFSLYCTTDCLQSVRCFPLQFDFLELLNKPIYSDPSNAETFYLRLISCYFMDFSVLVTKTCSFSLLWQKIISQDL